MFGFFNFLHIPIIPVDNTEQRVLALEKQLAEARTLLEKIVVVDGQDKGVVLKDTESPTYYEHAVEGWVYKYQHFSQLGDALIELHEKLKQD